MTLLSERNGSELGKVDEAPLERSRESPMS